MDYLQIKKKLHQKCLSAIQKRIEHTQSAMNQAQCAANQEGKSSVGDKYETTRSMMQIERNRNAEQLSEILKLHRVLLQINPSLVCRDVRLGSLVFTNRGVFFMAVSIGKLVLENQTYFAISLATPLGSALKDLKAGNSFLFHQQNYTIEAIF